MWNKHPCISKSKLDIFCIILIFCFLFFIADGISLSTLTLASVVRFLWTGTPAIAIYFIVRLFLPLYCGAFVSFVFLFLLYFINVKKIALTGSPLSMPDMLSVSNFSVAIRYVGFRELLLVFLFLFGVFLFNKRGQQEKSIVFIVIGIFSIILSLAPYHYFLLGDNKFTNRLNYVVNRLEMGFLSWDLPFNAKRNGVYYHILQTGVKRPVPKPDKVQMDALKKITDTLNINGDFHRPRKIIHILCESCWYDESHFRDIFEPLSSINFQPFRALSPVYGAGTANSEFEFLTGLSSYNSVLTGIAYQGYANDFRDNSESLPRALSRAGYLPFSLHNNSASFWQRDIVYKKFGFHRFFSLEDMKSISNPFLLDRKTWQWQPDDYLLYKSALMLIEKHKDESLFLNLITMSGHGPYEYENDHGEKRYSIQMHEAVSRIISFVKQVEKIDPDTLFFIYGDHKPALNYYFYSNGILNKDIFYKTGSNDSDFAFREKVNLLDYGDVPVWVKYRNSDVVKNFILKSNGKSFFCVSKNLNDFFYKIKLYSFVLVDKNDICDSDYKEFNSLSIPESAYSIMLF